MADELMPRSDENGLAKTKMNSYIEKLHKINNSLINGYYPDNFYLRIYYDDNIKKIKIIVI